MPERAWARCRDSREVQVDCRRRHSQRFCVLATLACSGGAEYLALQKFFEASRLRDRTALRSISTVSFEPMADGTLTTFKITSSRPRSNANRLGRIHQRSVSPS